MDESQRELNARTYLALGRFVVAFSGLLYSLETATLFLMELHGQGRTLHLVTAALADRTAGPIMKAFFSVFHERWKASITEQDTKILKCLRREIEAITNTRNRLMHDAWTTPVRGGDPEPQVMERFRMRTHGTGADYERSPESPRTIEGYCADLSRLSMAVNATTFRMIPGATPPHLALSLTVVDKKIVLVPSGAGASGQ